MQAEKEPSSTGMTLGLAVLFGVMGASIQSDVGGFTVGAMIGALLAQIFHLRGRMSSLAKQLRELKSSIAADERPASAGEPRKAVPPSRVDEIATPAAVSTPSVSQTQPPPPRPTPAERQPPVPTPPRRPIPPRPIEPSPAERAVAGFIAWLKRGNPLARIGVVILFFGAAFLAKYAADNSLLPIELRFMAIAIGAFVLLIVGWRLRDKRAVYAQLLQGGGIAGLYLTVFAATKLYQLLPLTMAFGLMVVIALAAAIVAVAQNALSLAVIGTAGGFLAPILVSTGSGNHIALFSYYAILNLGVFAVAWFRTWRVLNVLGFLFTFTITGLWRASGYHDDDLYSADFFLILFFLMYVAVSILNCVRQPPNLKGYVSGSLVFGLPVVAFSLHATLVSKIEYALAWSALALGAFYLALGWTLYRTRRENFRLLVEAFAALGIIFASLAIPLAFDTRTTAAMWAVEGAGLLWLGVRQQRKLPRAFGILLQIGAGGGYMLGLNHLHGTQPLLNSAYLGAVMVGVSGVFSGYWLYRNREEQANYEAGGYLAFTLWGVAWWLFGGLNEIDRHLPTATLGATLIYVTFTVAVLALLAAKLDWPLPRAIALFMPALAAVFGLVFSISLEHPFAQWGALGWGALLVAHFWMLRMNETGELPGTDYLHAGTVWFLVLLLPRELTYHIAQHTIGVWSLLPWGLVPALVLAWAGRRKLVPEWPLATHAHAYRVPGAMPVAVAMSVWIVFINLTSSGAATWLPYLPLLNPLDISVVLCFLSLALWWSALTEEQRESLPRGDDRVLIAILAGMVFLWLNSALIRSLHHNWGGPITAYGIVHSTLVQASLSIFWGVLGFIAMTIAARQRWRYVWIVGAALMIVVVAKLFLVDLSKIGTIARIASFLTVGVLLLVTGYLAPLPPRKQSDIAAEEVSQ